MIRVQKGGSELGGRGLAPGKKKAAFEGEVLCPAQEGQGFLDHHFLMAKTNIP